MTISTPEQNKDNALPLTPKAKYEKTGRGKTLLRVQLTKTDDTNKWETLKSDITSQFGTAKEGIFALYTLAQQAGVFSNSKENNKQLEQKYLPLSNAPKDNKDGILIFDEITNSWVISFWRNKVDFNLGFTSCWTDKDMLQVKGSVWVPLPTKP